MSPFPVIPDKLLMLLRQGKEAHAMQGGRSRNNAPLQQMLCNDETPELLYNGMVVQQGNTIVS